MDELTLFVELLQIVDDEDRQARLAEIASSEPVLAKRLAELLEAHNRASQFLEEPAQFDDFEKKTTVPLVESEKPGQSIGPYKLLQKIGEGGMGIVYMAEQSVPVQRRVALKVIKAGMDSKRVIARFEAERQALALMDHPNIAKVLDAGTTDNGRPYFVMELVKGVPITTYCDERKLSIRERLELMVPVCQAIQHAHQKGIIHRDIKPSNVLVAQYDEKPVPKVIDFGVAKATSMKLTDKTMFTEFGQVIGTIEYMSPEQAQFNQLDIDTRSDIYSLGVMLYELTTGSTPLDGNTLRSAGIAEMMRMIREVDPPKPSHKLSTVATLPSIAATRNVEPSKLRGTVKGELDWIIMKALEKERVRRYATCADLSDDLQRFLNGDAVEAVPPSLQYKVMKSMRRNKGVTIAASLIAASIVASAIFSSIRYINERAARQDAERNREIASARAIEAQQAADEATRQRQEAELQREETRAQRDLAQQNLYFADMRLAAVDVEAGNLDRAEKNLIRHVPLNEESGFRGWEWYYLITKCRRFERELFGHTGFVSDVCWSPDGQLIASASYDNSVCIWQASDGKLLRIFDQGSTIKICLAWSHDSSKLAWGAAYNDSAVQIWNRDRNTIDVLYGDGGSVWTLDWDSTDHTLAVGHIAEQVGATSSIVVWDVRNKEVLNRFTLENYGNIQSAVWDPDNTGIAIANTSKEGSVFWNIDSPPEKLGNALQVEPTALDYHPVESKLAIGTMSGECLVLDYENKVITHRWKAHERDITEVEWSPTGDQLLSASKDGRICLWRYADTDLLATFSSIGATKVSYSPNGKYIATTGADKGIRIWPATPQANPTILQTEAEETELAWTGDNEILYVLDMRTNELEGYFTKDGFSSSEAKQLVDTSQRVVSFLYNVDRSDHRFTNFDAMHKNFVAPMAKLKVPWTNNKCPASTTEIFGVISPNAKILAYRDGNRLRVRNLHTHQTFVGPENYPRGISWSPDSEKIAAAGFGVPGTNGLDRWAAWVIILDATTGDVQTIPIGSDRVQGTCVAFSNDGKHVAAGTELGLCEVWNLDNGQRIASDRKHLLPVSDIKWSPDDQRIVSGSHDGQIQIWDSYTGKALLSVDPMNAAVREVEWSPDGRKLAASSANGTIKIWDASKGYELSSSQEWLHLIEPLHWQNFDRYVEQSKWAEAVGILDKIIESGDERPLPWIRKAMIALKDADHDSFSRICRNLTERFRDSESKRYLQEVAALCVISPEMTIDYGISLAMAKKSVDMFVNQGTGWHYRSKPLVILGANLYRADRNKDALDALIYAKTRSQDSNRWMLDFYLSMCLHNLGHKEKSRMYFANACMAAAQGMESRLNWSDKIILKTLRNEAATLLRLEPIESIKFAKEEKLVRDFTPYATVAANVGEELFISAMSAYAPSVTPVLNGMAWDVATSLDASAEELELAITRATKAVELEPNESSYHNTLGIVHYRAGHWSDSVNSLNRSIELRANSEKSIALDSLYLAMAHWQLGEKEKAMECHKRGIVDLETNKVPDAEAVRPEVEKLLGIEQSPAQESEPKQETRPDDNAGLNAEEQETASTVEPVAATERSE